jgi:hypothetical protein
VAHGQPPPADRASGVSVPVRTDTPVPPQVGTVVLVAGSGVIRFNTDTRRQTVLPLPAGVAALRVWTVDGQNIALGRLPHRPVVAKLPVEDRPTDPPLIDSPPRTAAWIVRAGHPPVPLGMTDTVAPSLDGRAVWLVHAGIAIRVPLRAGSKRVTVRLPRSGRLIADTPSGLIVTSGRVLTREEAAALPAVTPTSPPATASTPGGTGTIDPPTPTLTHTAGPGDQSTPSTVPGGTAATPLATTLIRPGAPPRLLAQTEALAAFGDVVLVRRADERLGVILLRSATKLPRWLPNLSAVEVTGPAAIDFDGATFAVLARVNEHVRLMVGPTNATTEAQINVVALDGGPPAPDATPPAFTASGRVLAVRPDGKVVYYLPGNRSGILLGSDLPPAAAVIQG